MEIKKISEGEYSTLLGMNGGMVESPDAKRIVYARKYDLEKSETEIWVCDRNLENHRKVFDVSCGNHNGPSATFITDSLIVFRDSEDNLPVFRIMDIDTGDIKYKIRAKESHCAENGKYPFSVSKEFIGKNPDYPEIDKCGIYILDVTSGKIELAVSERDILDMVRGYGLTPNEYTASVAHVQLNPSATAVMMRLGVEDCPVFGALGCVDLDTGKTHVIPDKPVHQLWFDDDTYMATRQFNQGKHIEMETSYIARFSKDGRELEVLGGISNHMDGSADRKWFAGDRCYPGFSPNVYLYRRGDKNGAAVFEIPHDEYITWNLQVHPNPSFSRDGKRLYFNKLCPGGGRYKTEAVFADISDIVGN
ncbi:MAG: hypothetical protein HFE49_07900 [Clostridia bacterium]|jgi:hypothetical protein|nr:hypothetical protein [Clostridia bacterium]